MGVESTLRGTGGTSPDTTSAKSNGNLCYRAFHRLNLIEKIGSGIGRIKKACKDNGIRVRFDTEGDL